MPHPAKRSRFFLTLSRQRPPYLVGFIIRTYTMHGQLNVKFVAVINVTVLIIIYLRLCLFLALTYHNSYMIFIF